MAEFTDAFNHVIEVEGGFVLTNDPDDKGGMTFAGISRKHWPDWDGWPLIDNGKEVPRRMVCDFYRDNFWAPIHGDALGSQKIATSIFSFAVNAGAKTSIKCAQMAACVASDGIVGKMTTFALNSIEPQLFLAKFALSKVAKYCAICTADPTQKKFLLGWLNRTLKEAA